MAIYGVAAGVDFAQAVATAVQRIYGYNPLQLAQMRLVVPTGRFARALTAALQQGGQAGVIPLVEPILPDDETMQDLLLLGSVEADAFAVPVSGWHKHMVFARLVQRALPQMLPAQALAYGGQLAAAHSHLSGYGVTPQAVLKVMPPALAAHWQRNTRVLAAVWQAYSAYLESSQQYDATIVRRARLQALAQRRWPGPVWAVGFNDTIPDALPVLRHIVQQPQGALVLPAADIALLNTQTPLPAAHPQAAMQKLVQAVAPQGTAVETVVEPLPGTPQHTPQSRFFAAVFATEQFTLHAPPVIPVLVAADTLHAEATVLALALRETLQQPQATAALVTPCRTLAARVQGVLAGWGLQADDSAGLPFLQSPQGTLLAQLLEVLRLPLQPLGVMGLVQHPLVGCGYTPQQWQPLVQALGRRLRGYVPGRGLAALRGHLSAQRVREKEREEHRQALDALHAVEGALSSLLNSAPQPLAHLLVLLEKTLAALAAEAPSTDVFLYEEGRAAAQELFTQLHAAAEGQPDTLTLPQLAETVSFFAAQQVVRTYGYSAGGGLRLEPRLRILGPLEARGVQATRLLAGGLNESVWPAAVRADVLPPALHQALGMPPPAQALGLAAHDVMHLLAHPALHLVSFSNKRDGSPVQPSRFLQRWRTVAGEEAWQQAHAGGQAYVQLAAQLTQGSTQLRGVQPLPQAVAAPAAVVRPQAWSASRLKRLLQCPYQFYARDVLHLEQPEPFNMGADARVTGILLHDALAAFEAQQPGFPPPFGQAVTVRNQPQAQAHLLALFTHAFATLQDERLQQQWQPRLALLAEHITALWAQQSAEVQQIVVEATASLPLGNTVTLHARADRMERTSHGTVIIDYKSGSPPSAPQVFSGFEPQMGTEAVLAAQGGFAAAGIPAAVPQALDYWYLAARRDNPLDVKKILSAKEFKNLNMDEWVQQVAERLAALAESVNTQAAPLPAVPGSKACDYCDASLLCRKDQWQQQEQADA